MEIDDVVVLINGDRIHLTRKSVDELQAGRVPDCLRHLGNTVRISCNKSGIGYAITESLGKPGECCSCGGGCGHESEQDGTEYGPEDKIIEVDDGYAPLLDVLLEAYQQASQGKGRERHANGLPFMEQPIMKLAEAHGLGFLTGQAAKKLQETYTLLELKGKGAAKAELLGAIVYTAAAVLYLSNEE